MSEKINHTERKISRETIHSGKVFNVYKDQVELENGVQIVREYIEHFGGVAVVAFSEDHKLIMVSQYRYGSGKTMLELPAGKIDLGEDPKETAMRELREETGYIPSELKLLSQMYPTPAYDSEKIYIYLAENLEKGEQDLDENEFLTIEHIPFEKALEMCLNREIEDAKTLVGILAYAQKLTDIPKL